VRDLPRDADTGIGLLVAHPQLIQRPIVRTADGRTRVGRDDARVVAAGRSGSGRP
jgi:arsenate reductase-like glutaredoxin family protein